MTNTAVTVEVALPLLLWKENEQFVAFPPALDLSTCGDSEQSAVSNFAEAVELFFETAIERRTLNDLLASLGWEASVDTWRPPSQSIEGQKSFAVRIPVPATMPAH